MPLILRVCCDLEPHSAGVVDQPPAVAERVDEEQPAPALFGGTAAHQLGPADARSRIPDLATDAVASWHQLELHRAARAMPDSVGHKLGDDQLCPPAIVLRNTAACCGLTDSFTRTRRSMLRRREFERN